MKLPQPEREVCFAPLDHKTGRTLSGAFRPTQSTTLSWSATGAEKASWAHNIAMGVVLLTKSGWRPNRPG